MTKRGGTNFCRGLQRNVHGRLQYDADFLRSNRQPSYLQQPTQPGSNLFDGVGAVVAIGRQAGIHQLATDKTHTCYCHVDSAAFTNLRQSARLEQEEEMLSNR